MIMSKKEISWQVNMQKKLMITLDESIYYGLCQLTEKSKINQFIEELLKLHVLNVGMHEGYRQMAGDKEREAEALEWSESLIGDISGEAW